jgi:hypothetical protein
MYVSTAIINLPAYSASATSSALVNYVPYDFTACAGITFSVSGCETIADDDIFNSNDQYLSLWDDAGTHYDSVVNAADKRNV